MPDIAERSTQVLDEDSSDDVIRIRGARVHNLQNVDLDIPRDQFVVITGPSGSGKSSLAFDTLFAEGQRQYIETLSTHARQFLTQMERPDVDLIEGLQPTICIDQRPFAANPRSTVATVTEIYDYLRVLMARLGEVRCHQCGDLICPQTPAQIQDRLMQFPEGTKAMLLAPYVRGRRGQHKDIFAKIRKAGFVRVRVDGDVFDLENVPELSPRKMHHIDAVVDRIVIREAQVKRISESVRLALKHADGLMIVCYSLESAGQTSNKNGTWRDELFSTLYACANCGVSFEELEPRSFSFNSPYGACPDCDGLGTREEFDDGLVLTDVTRSLSKGAIAPISQSRGAALTEYKNSIGNFLEQHGITWDVPLSELKTADVENLMRGDDKGFLGVMTLLEREYATTTSKKRIEQLAAFRGNVICGSCNGSRLRGESNSVRLGDKSIHEITQLCVSDARDYFWSLEFADTRRDIATPLKTEIVRRLEFLQRVGVDYLTLDRAANSLSGGELQRVRLASSIGSGLVGVCYILDEPSIGLHPRDNQRLIQSLHDLQQQGNTVIVVEHDEAIMRSSDRLIDMGPAAGKLGGKIIAEGPIEEIQKQSESTTARYLAGALKIDIPEKRRRVSKSRSLTIEKAAANNLKEVDIQIPLGAFVCITGVSGSGKSSLINETLTRAVIRRLGGLAPKPGAHRSLRGTSQIDKVVEIDQSPIGRTPRSNPATYTGVFDEVRKVFAGTRDAKQRGFGVGRFSFNVRGGRCDTCNGQGVQRIEMNFLPDIFVVCDQCHGTRFNRQTLDVKYRGKSIADVLDMSIDDATVFFENFTVIHRLLKSLQNVGLGYLALGQQCTALSGGEAQRIKLATELARVDSGKTLYVLDEPTTGLHFDDIKKLLEVLLQLVDRGNTVVVVEHHLDVIKCADWIIDLGPEGGQNGGEVVAVGTPEQVADEAASFTGHYLKTVLNDRPAKNGSS